MVQVLPARLQARDRRPQQPQVQSRSYPPPIRGLVTNEAMITQGQGIARLIDNFRVTQETIEPRGGSNWRVSTTSSAAVKQLFAYTAAGSEKYFAAAATTVAPSTDATADETVLTADITGQTSGVYSWVNNTTSGGTYLTIVNGDDSPQIYSGSTWQAITGVSSPIAITGVTTSDLSYVWLYRNRQFFIEGGTLSAWYLGTNSVGGAATEIPLASVFNRGGSLLFGATLSSDSGDGMDDRCVFVTTEGEAAIYHGGDPSSSTDWSLDGVYDIGKPLGAHAHERVSGDLLVATTTGLIPLRAAIQHDASMLAGHALTRPIEGDWRLQVLSGGAAVDWRVIVWDEKNELIVAPVTANAPATFLWVMNLTTNAWYRWTGWEASAIAVFGDGLHFGGTDGKVYEGDVGGQDAGSTFVCRLALAFDELDIPGSYKTAHGVQARWMHQFPINPQHSVAADNVIDFPVPPAVASAVTNNAGSLWDVALWDVALWASGNDPLDYVNWRRWTQSGKQGRNLAIQAQVTSGASYKLPLRLIGFDLTYTVGAVYA